MNMLSYKTHEIMNIPVAAISMTQAVAICKSYIEKSGSYIIATANAEMIMRAQEDKDLKKVLCNADLVVADGAGVLWAGEVFGTPFPERVTGADLMQELMVQAVEYDWPIYFLGGAPGVAANAAACFEAKYKKNPVVGIHDGFFDEEEESAIIQEIRNSQAKLLFVGMGVPKQEKWIYEHKQELGNLIAIGVGGVFDVMAGHLKRAPLWMQKHRLEWAYRLFLQPSRITRMVALPKFMLAVKKWKKDSKRS